MRGIRNLSDPQKKVCPRVAMGRQMMEIKGKDLRFLKLTIAVKEQVAIRISVNHIEFNNHSLL